MSQDVSSSNGKQHEESGQARFFREVNVEFLIHELKDPLSVIETNARMLLAKQDRHSRLSERQSRTLQRILRSSQKAHAMLGELLEVGRAEAACFNCRSFQPLAILYEVLLAVVETEAGDLLEIDQSAADPKAGLAHLSALGIRVDALPSAELLEIHQDEIKFRQIVGNLLKNAMKYRRHRVILHLASQHDRLTVAVRDDGPGIAPEHQEAIFERYKQVGPCPGLARDGHGLGLAVSRILARSMGGDIVVESQLGQGAVFRLVLPHRFPQE